MKGSLVTSNLVEVAYLISRGHGIHRLDPGAQGAYGVRELGVELRGQDIELDHRNFLCHGTASPREIRLALGAMARALEAEVSP